MCVIQFLGTTVNSLAMLITDYAPPPSLPLPAPSHERPKLGPKGGVRGGGGARGGGRVRGGEGGRAGGPPRGSARAAPRAQVGTVRKSLFTQ